MTGNDPTDPDPTDPDPTDPDPTDPDPDEGLPTDMGFEAARAAQVARWAATTPDQRLVWLAEAQRFAHQAGALPRPRPQPDLEGWNEPPGSQRQDPD